MLLWKAVSSLPSHKANSVPNGSRNPGQKGGKLVFFQAGSAWKIHLQPAQLPQVLLCSQLLCSKDCTSICRWWSAEQQRANVFVNLQQNDLLPSWWSICVGRQHVCLYKWAGPLCHVSLPTFERKSLLQFFLGVKTKSLSPFTQPATEKNPCKYPQPVSQGNRFERSGSCPKRKRIHVCL